MLTRRLVTVAAFAIAALAGERALNGQSALQPASGAAALSARRIAPDAPEAAAAVAEGNRRQDTTPPPYAPEQSMARLKVEPGFRIELVASEPDVQSPVAMDIDEDGRLFVVEMPGYPLDVSPTGRVKLLEDTDGDGRVDRRTLFADNLRLPSGVMRYKRGVLVTSPPDLLYLEDTNGDGRADRREVVLTGFARTNPQHAVNHPVYGLDNWIYLAHSGGSQPVIYRDLFGDLGQPLTFPARPELAGLDSRGRGVRVKPDFWKVEGLSSRTQYGNAFDAYGRFFAHNNSIHARHEVIAARYLERNPHLLLPSAMADISDHGNGNIMPITHGARFDLLTEAGQFTSACGLTVYTGGAFPDGFEGTSFVAEPVHNLVHRDVLSPSGSTFVASRARRDMEFLASTDSWFRPVNLYIGPEGALYVIDYYRPYIEHPEWASSDLQKNPAVLSTGQDRGRIYRIVSETAARTAPRPHLGSASDEALVRALADRNVWQRRTAQRLLVTGNRRAAVPALARLAAARPSPLARLHALWTLEGLGRLDPAGVRQALTDPDPGVRENAIVLAERWLSDPPMSAALLALADDPNPRVRFQLLATLGSLDTAASRAAQERLLIAGIDDEWMQVAALSASSDRAAAWFGLAIGIGDGIQSRPLAERPAALTAAESPGRAQFFDRLGGVIAAREKPEELARAIAVITDAAAPAGDWWRAALLEGVARGISGSRGDRRRLGASQDTLLALATGDQARLRRAAVTLLAVSGVEDTGQKDSRTEGQQGDKADGQKGNRVEGQKEDERSAVGRALARAATIAADGSATPDARIDAMALLALSDASAYQRVFEASVNSAEPDAVQIAGVNALGRLPGDTAATFLLAKWPTLTTPVRSAAATVILARPQGAQAMLDALQAGAVKPWMLNFWQKRSLIMHRDERIRASGRTILEESPDARARTVARYAAALDGRGSAARGADVFARTCAMCHQIDGRGGMAMGPDLSTVRHRPMPLLLADILEPSRSIAQHYETYQVTRASGDTIVGVIGDESPAAITFRQGPGQSITVMRRDIRQMSVSPQSTMPESLHEQVTPAEMADLLAYLTTPHPNPLPAGGEREQALPEPGSGSAASIAAALLDERHDQQARESLARDAAPRAADIVMALAADLPDDEGEEYRRIPWIWRVAVAAGRSTNAPVLRALLDASMPHTSEPLRDWQAVVLGGGVVMGLSQAGAWPTTVMAPWLDADPARAARWARSLDLAIVMADAATVRNGTRYDALRMLATLPWERAGAQLTRYLAAHVDAELQAGAIGGLSDLQDARAAHALVQHAAQLAPENRRHAIDALLRTAERREHLRRALTAGTVEDAWLTPEQRQRLSSSH